MNKDYFEPDSNQVAKKAIMIMLIFIACWAWYVQLARACRFTVDDPTWDWNPISGCTVEVDGQRISKDFL